MNSICESFESVAVSTRMRLARNFADFPFPGMLMRDAHAEEQAQEIERLVGASLAKVDDFTLYEMRNLTDERGFAGSEHYHHAQRGGPCTRAIFYAGL